MENLFRLGALLVSMTEIAEGVADVAIENEHPTGSTPDGSLMVRVGHVTTLPTTVALGVSLLNVITTPEPTFTVCTA
jgi:hypothetical protein